MLHELTNNGRFIGDIDAIALELAVEAEKDEDTAEGFRNHGDDDG